MMKPRALALALLALATASASAQMVGDDAQAEQTARFAGSRWSQSLPNRDFTGGCIAGFLAFQFSPVGYFIYNNHVHGSWRADARGNVVLRTKDGLTSMLIMVGENQLLAPANFGSLPRATYFERCP